MARPFTKQEANDVINRHMQLWDDINTIIDAPEVFEKKAAEALDNALKNEAFNKLANEEIVLKGRITEPSEELTDVVSAICRLNRISKLKGPIMKLRIAHPVVQVTIEKLSSVLGGAKWLFSGKEKKKDAEESFVYLDKLLKVGYESQVASVINTVKEVEAMGSLECWEDFQKDQEPYINRFQVYGIDMKGKRVLPEIDSLKDFFTEHENRIESVLKLPKDTENEIVQKINAYLDEKTLEKLYSVPVDEITKIRPDMRVKPIKDGGVVTVADACLIPDDELAGLPEIGPDAAAAIKDFAIQYAIEVKKDIKVKLSADDRTETSDALVEKICYYRQINKMIPDLHRLKKTAANTIFLGFNGINLYSNEINWFFKNEAQKQRIIDAYLLLIQEANGQYIRRTEELMMEMAAINVTPEAAWADYMNYNIEYELIIRKMIRETA